MSTFGCKFCGHSFPMNQRLGERSSGGFMHCNECVLILKGKTCYSCEKTDDEEKYSCHSGFVYCHDNEECLEKYIGYCDQYTCKQKIKERIKEWYLKDTGNKVKEYKKLTEETYNFYLTGLDHNNNRIFKGFLSNWEMIDNLTEFKNKYNNVTSHDYAICEMYK